MNTVPGDGESTPDDVAETDTHDASSLTSVEASSATEISDEPLTSTPVSSSVDDVVPLSSQPSVRPAKRSLWSTRVSLLLVAALVGGLAGWYASTSKTGPGGVTIDEITNPPGAAYLPGGI